MTDTYTSELDYLTQSLNVLNERHQTFLKEVRDNKTEMEILKADIRSIKSARLQGAATQAFNHLSKRNTELNNTIKSIREDLKWIKRLMKIVMSWFKKHE